jgi:hypothetical protein
MVIRLTVLIANHPHLTHLMRTRATKSWGSRFGFGFGAEHRLFGLAMRLSHGSRRRHQKNNCSETNAIQRHGLDTYLPTMPMKRESALKCSTTT